MNRKQRIKFHDIPMKFNPALRKYEPDLHFIVAIDKPVHNNSSSR